MSTAAVTPQPDFQYIKLPDGSYGKFRSDADDATIKAAISKDFPDAYKSEHPSAINSPAPTMGDKIKQFAGDTAKGLGIGAFKGAGNTVSGVSDLIHAIPGVGPKIIPDSGLNAFHKMNEPDNGVQKAGYAGEQVGEYFLPTGLEEKAATGAGKLLVNAPRASRFIVPAVKAGANAIETGIRNKIQGGDFTTGAEAGGIASGVGQGLQAAAPALAESALGVTNRMRGNGKTIGKSILDETSGVTPKSLFKQAAATIAEYNRRLESAANASPVVASTTPAINILHGAISDAQKQNSGAKIEQLQKVVDQLTKEYGTGKAIPTDVSARRILDLKRGIGDLVNSWAPQERKGIQPITQRVYGALDAELDKAVPGSKELNQKMSSLIPAKTRAKILSQGAGTGQRIMNRISRPTGALASAGIGGVLGYERGGPEKAIEGAALGLALPEIISSPTSQMIGARFLKSGMIPTFGKGIALQLDRPKPKSGDNEDK
jgi:hypothetical protein